MGAPFIPLPLSTFPQAARPSIARLNAFLLELSRLEGTIRQPRSSRRSDATVARRGDVQVDVSRITPTITEVVSGQSTVVGTPALTFGTANVVGTTTTALSVNSTVAIFDTTVPAALASTASAGSVAFAARRDHVHLFPPSLMTTTTSDTLTLTESAGILVLTPSTADTKYSGNFWRYSLGTFPSLLTVEEYASLDGTVLLNFETAGAVLQTVTGLYVVAPTSNVLNASGLAANQVIGVDLSLGSNQNYCLKSFIAISPADIAARAVGCWDALFPAGGFGGIWTGATIITGYDMSNAMSLGPLATSGAALKAYGARLREPSITTTNGGWTETAGFIVLSGGTTAGTTNAKVAGGIIEMPRQGQTLQVGLDFVNVAGGTDTPTDRIGLRIPAMARGTNRAGIQITVDTGNAAGAHLRLVDKAGDVSAPTTGDIWRKSAAIQYYNGQYVENLAGYISKAKWAVD